MAKDDGGQHGVPSREGSGEAEGRRRMCGGSALDSGAAGAFARARRPSSSVAMGSWKLARRVVAVRFTKGEAEECFFFVFVFFFDSFFGFVSDILWDRVGGGTASGVAKHTRCFACVCRGREGDFPFSHRSLRGARAACREAEADRLASEGGVATKGIPEDPLASLSVNDANVACTTAMHMSSTSC